MHDNITSLLKLNDIFGIELKNNS